MIEWLNNHLIVSIHDILAFGFITLSVAFLILLWILGRVLFWGNKIYLYFKFRKGNETK